VIVVKKVKLKPPSEKPGPRGIGTKATLAAAERAKERRKRGVFSRGEAAIFLGCSDAWITKMRNAGVIQMEEDGTYDAKKLQVAWARYKASKTPQDEAFGGGEGAATKLRPTKLGNGHGHGADEGDDGDDEGEGGFDPNAYLTPEEVEQKRSYITLTSARTRLVGLQSDAQEMVLAKLRADLVPLSVIEHLITHLFSAVRAGILAIPERVSQEVAACTREEDIRDVLRQAVEGALNDLSGPETLQSIRSAMDDARGALGGSQGLVGSISAARPNYSKRVGRPPSKAQRG
jgi:hypothetical protein